jgi:hypothetical protein
MPPWNTYKQRQITKKQKEKPSASLLFGAGDRGRTDTVSPPLDFESSTSANSITPAKLDLIIQHIVSKHKRKFSFFKIFMFILHFRSPLAFRF